MPDVLMRTDDFRRIEAIDIALSRLSIGIVAARCEGRWQDVTDGLRLCDSWLDRRLQARG